jgi:Protein of unknown function (DUF2800)
MTPRVAHLPRIDIIEHHAPLPPSSAERWMRCPGSVRAEALTLGRPTSPYAIEGSAAHVIFALALLTDLLPSQLTDDAAMAEHLDDMVTAARTMIGTDVYLIEHRLPALPYLVAVWGSTDLLVLNALGQARIIGDLKFGKGLLVAASSPQLQIYALLAARAYGIGPDGIDAVILQPRAYDPGGHVRAVHYSAEDLGRFEGELRESVVATEAPDAARISGPHCRFCAAADSCYERLRACRAGLGESLSINADSAECVPAC